MKVLVDDVAVLAMEYCLMDGLSEIFCPAMVVQMEDRVVNGITTESHNSRTERARVVEKLESLKAGLQALNRLDHQKEMCGPALSRLNARDAGDPSLKGGESNSSGEAVSGNTFDLKGEDQGQAENLAKGLTSGALFGSESDPVTDPLPRRTTLGAVEARETRGKRWEI